VSGLQATIVAPSRAWAEIASSRLSEGPLGEFLAASFRESEAGWLLEVYADEALDPVSLRAALAPLEAEAGSAFRYEKIADADWVSISQSGLAPVFAGRFIIHGSHDRQRLRPSRFRIEIDAGRAFGTAHHATTAGCLLAIDRLAKSTTVMGALDLGAGSGVLAIAAARAFGCRITAIDIDPVAIEVARENCRKNGVTGQVTLAVGDGLRPAGAYRPPYDLTMANILAGPLIALAPRIKELTEINRPAILSGLLAREEREALRAYQSRGFTLCNRIAREGWVTLTLRRSA
jgi:ribosomal protein L11 methyltransferase